MKQTPRLQFPGRFGSALGSEINDSEHSLNVNIFGSRKWVPHEKNESRRWRDRHHSPSHGTHFRRANGVDFPPEQNRGLQGHALAPIH